VGPYVALVAFQIEFIPSFNRDAVSKARCQSIQGIHQAGYTTKLGTGQGQTRRPALRQHLPHSFPLLTPSLPRFGHLLTEVLSVKDQAIE
jgi:hypothetical protein